MSTYDAENLLGLPPVLFNQTTSGGPRSNGSASSSSYNNPSEVLARITERDIQRYQEDYVPVEDRAIDSLRDMSIIDDAKARVGQTSTLATAKQRSARELSRYGLRQTRSEQASQKANLRIGQAAGDADTMNNARLNQFDRNLGFRNELINIGRGVSEQANSGLASASEMQTNRNNANDAARAAQKAQNYQMAGAVAAAALMFFV